MTKVSSKEASWKLTALIFLMMIVFAPEVPALRVVLGPLSPNSVAMLFCTIVICDPGSINALTGRVLVGVTILQIKVNGRPRFFGL